MVMTAGVLNRDSPSVSIFCCGEAATLSSFVRKKLSYLGFEVASLFESEFVSMSKGGKAMFP